MSEVRFRGGATDEDVAAIAAVLAARSASTPPEDAYRQWRRTRLAALHAVPAGDTQSSPPR